MKIRIIAFILAVVLCLSAAGCGLFGESEREAVVTLQNSRERIAVTQKSFYGSGRDVYDSLSKLKFGLDNSDLTSDEVYLFAEQILRNMEGLGDYYNFFGNTSYTEKGVTYGASAVENPIGGGIGYIDIYTTGDHIATNDNEFKAALSRAASGQVIFIPADAVIDLSDMRVAESLYVSISRGVTIASDRGHNGSAGGTLRFSFNHTALLRCIGNNRITGLCLQGANATFASGQQSGTPTFGIVMTGNNIEIDNCEISGFTNAGISMSGSDTYIHHNYIHDIRGADGYGIRVNNGSASIESNLFSNNTVNVYSESFDKLIISGNIDTGTVSDISVKLGGKSGSQLELTNNSFLGAGTPYILENIEDANATVKQNIFDFTDSKTLSLLGIKSFEEAETVKSITAVPDFTMNVFAGDMVQVFDLIQEIKVNCEDREKALDYVIKAISELCGFSDYYYYLDKINIEQDGAIYGAFTEEGDSPIGGGMGMLHMYSTGDYIVSDLESLKSALERAKSGEVVFIKGDAFIDTTPLAESNSVLTLKEGVVLASDRGRRLENGSISTGAMLFSTQHASVMITAYAEAKIEGLTIVGADTWKHMAHHARGTASTGYTDYYYLLPLTIGVRVKGDGFEMTNCEVSGFSNSGVLLDNAKDALIRNSYFHHNQRNGFGYGICHSKASTSVIEYNLFNFDRHSVAADGSSGSGYIARYNIQMGEAIYHVFDAHGGSDRGDGTNIACDFVDMYNNTILCDKLPYKKRGVPQEYSRFYRNIVLNPIEYYSTRYMEGINMSFYDNIFGIAESEMPVYDYNGGREFTFTVNVFNKAVRENGVTAVVFNSSENEYISSADAGLRYAFILVFAPDTDGTYRITEYGNNLDNGTIYGWNEKVYIPENGFVLAFTDENKAMKALYDYICDEYAVIYNTTASVHGGYKVVVTGEQSAEISISVTAAVRF